MRLIGKLDVLRVALALRRDGGVLHEGERRLSKLRGDVKKEILGTNPSKRAYFPSRKSYDLRRRPLSATVARSGEVEK